MVGESRSPPGDTAHLHRPPQRLWRGVPTTSPTTVCPGAEYRPIGTSLRKCPKIEPHHKWWPAATGTSGRSTSCWPAIRQYHRVTAYGWKKTSNLFRGRSHQSGPGLDVSGLAGVLAIDTINKTVDVAGMCTYEDLVAATLPLGLSPLVVPQLKTITVGGAVTGLGIESTSFRNGLVHESVLELDILTGAGDVVTATADNEYADLFHGFPNSYGTLGYATRVRLELEAVPRSWNWSTCDSIPSTSSSG